MQRQSNDKDFRKIDFIFYNEREIQDAVIEARHTRKNFYGELPPDKNHTADPTAARAIFAVGELESVTLPGGERIFHPERWLLMAEVIALWCAADPLKEQVLRRRYRWEDYRRTCYELHISQKTYSNILRDIRTFAMICAVELGLINVIGRLKGDAYKNGR